MRRLALAEIHAHPDYSRSLDLARRVSAQMEGKTFHHYFHVLYVLRLILGSGHRTYVEIGSYHGASAALMLMAPCPTTICCVDTLDLDPAHWGRAPDRRQEDILYDNLRRFMAGGPSEAIIVNGNSRDSVETVRRIAASGVDLLFIDGDHRLDEVLLDFAQYAPMVNPGGFVVFDDYDDPLWSPEVRIAVDRIASGCGDGWNVVGLVEDRLAIQDGYKGNEFIIQKLARANVANGLWPDPPATGPSVCGGREPSVRRVART